jgi:hypothetical protein
MSVEVWDPVAHTWSMCKEMHRYRLILTGFFQAANFGGKFKISPMSSLLRKRWGAGAAVLHQLLVVVGGRGKRVGHTAEVRIEPLKNITSSKNAV